MKKFLIYTLLFLAPIVGYLVFLEIVVSQIPNSYSYKYNYIKEHGEKIRALAIGHSQMYDGFKPESFFKTSFNLGNSAQHYLDNYYLLEELLPYLPNLELVIMPIGYLNVGVNGKDEGVSERCCYYHKYMNIDYDGNIPLSERFECLDPLRASKKVFTYFIKHADIVGCDSLGRRNTQYLKNRKHELGYDNLFDVYTLKQHLDMCIKDEEYLRKAIEMLNNKNIKIVLVSPPYYWNCCKNINMEQKLYLKDYTTKLCMQYDIPFLDLEEDTTFVYDDFFNESHLTELGAEKFTKKISEFMSKIY